MFIYQPSAAEPGGSGCFRLITSNCHNNANQQCRHKWCRLHNTDAYLWCQPSAVRHNCRTLAWTKVSIHVILANGDTDFGNYDSGAITFDCNSNGKWAVPAGAEHPGDVVDGYSCVTSATG
ncbi:hypothetical protein niasHT_002741 [Heterodera trifolii]|uniref:Uncharacterized protein n=1 Tax=Heterodera trifolii TaxID=157864 RepID=A0ABD2M9Z9_9BILA